MTDHRLPTPAPLPASAHDTNRRHFVRDLALGGLGLGTLGLSACGGGGGASPAPAPAPSPAAPAVSYAHGVASGDPLADRVILWTRLTPAETSTPGAVTVGWEVAASDTFATVVASGTTTTDATRDWTVKVDATGLQPGSAYWYRFSVGTQRSPAGRTRTLPTGAVTQVKLAVVSCANRAVGEFNVYDALAQRSDLDAVVHLGDYLYEYAQDSAATSATPRALLDPASELLSLSDYRRRYAQYRTDTRLRALHAAVPMIPVWDDHEFANNAWRDGALGHNPATEGSFAARRAAAAQAWHEWLPVRTGSDSLLIYRSFAFGDLLALHMLDTRLAGRDQPLDYANFTTAAGGVDTAALTTALAGTGRQLLGTTQAAWLQQQMQASTALWQVLGQQVLMGRMPVPLPVLSEALTLGTGLTLSAYGALVLKARTNPAALTAAEQALLAQPGVPWDLDAWDGYPAAREALLAQARALDKNLVVLAGDSHNAWASDLQDSAGQQAGVEFATPSVTSAGLESRLPGQDPATLSAGLPALIGPLQYADTSRRGCLLLTATASECRADWLFVSTVASSTYTAVSDKALRVLPGVGNRKVVAV